MTSAEGSESGGNHQRWCWRATASTSSFVKETPNHMKTLLTDRLARLWPLWLALSVALNFLAGGLWVLRDQSQVTTVPAAVSVPPAVAPAEMPAVKVEAKSEPLHWRQLDAPDFPGFVANLRAIGCPEATIRDIVTGELREIYSLRRTDGVPVQDQSSKPSFSEYSPEDRNSPDVPEPAEIQRMLVQLLEPVPAASAAVTAAPTLAATPVTNSTTASNVADIPAAFLVGNAPGQSVAGTTELATTVNDPNLHPETAEQLNRMRNDFAEAVAADDDGARGNFYSSASAGMASVSPGDYYRRWLKAKRDSDEAFSSLYGGDALISAQQQGLIEASAQQYAK
jgi:hypothetical protein